jgi:hypothetical protein
MAECDFILSDTDQRSLLEFLIKNGGRFVPSLPYTSPVHQVLLTLADVERVLRSEDLNGPVFVLWDGLSMYPLEFSHIKKGGGMTYCLKARYGGPCLELIPSRTIAREPGPKIISGSVGHYRSYYVSSGGLEVAFPQDLKKKYLGVTRYLRSYCTKLQAGCRSYLVGPDALHWLQGGATTNAPGLALDCPHSSGSSVKGKGK